MPSAVLPFLAGRLFFGAGGCLQILNGVGGFTANLSPPSSVPRAPRSVYSNWPTEANIKAPSQPRHAPRSRDPARFFTPSSSHAHIVRDRGAQPPQLVCCARVGRSRAPPPSSSPRGDPALRQSAVSHQPTTRDAPPRLKARRRRAAAAAAAAPLAARRRPRPWSGTRAPAAAAAAAARGSRARDRAPRSIQFKRRDIQPHARRCGPPTPRVPDPAVRQPTGGRRGELDSERPIEATPYM